MCASRNEMLEGRAPMAYLSFPSLKDPRSQSHTAEIVAPFSYRALESFRKEPWRRRGTDYESAKGLITQALLDLVEKQHPGFRDLVAYAELAHASFFRIFHGSAIGDDLRVPGYAGPISKNVAHAQDADPELIPHRHGCGSARSHGRLDGRSRHSQHAPRSHGVY